MKHPTLYFFLIFIYNLSAAQCLDKLVLNTNEDLISFLEDYPNCNYVGSLTINGVFDNISALEALDSVDMLTIHNSQLDSFVVNSLFEIKFSIGISENENMKYVRVKFIPSSVPSATILLENNISLDSFILDASEIKFISILNQTQSNFHFDSEKTNLTGIFAFNSCVFSGSKPKVSYQFEFYGEDEYNSFLSIQNSFDVTNVEFIYIGYKTNFSSIGISDIQHVESLRFSDIEFINIEDFASWSLILNRLILRDCKSLDDLTPLKNITLNNLKIENLHLLNSLQGVNFSDTLQGISLVNNSILTDISSIESVDTIIGREGLYDILIEGNENLSWCSYKAICDRNSIEDEKVVIQNNNGACENNEAVNTFCLSSSEEYDFKDYKVFPNPVGSDLFIDSNSNDIHLIEIFNINGQKLFSLDSYNEKIDLSSLEPGVYLLKIIDNHAQSYSRLFTKI